MKHHPLITDLRNAYEAHDRDAFDRACAHVEQRLSEAASRPHDTSDCARGSACICFSPRAHDLCSYRIAKPEGGKL